MKKVKMIEFEGRGISLRDAIDTLRFADNGELILMTDQKNYKEGRLRIKKVGEKAVPVIIYDGKEDDEICFAFQGRVRDGEYVDFDVNLIGDALTYYMMQKNETNDQEEGLI